MEIKPLSPQEVRDLRPHHILPEIIEVINEMLCENFDGVNSVKIIRNDIVKKTINKCASKDVQMTDHILVSKGHLNFESIYEEVGWEVEYNAPDRGENFESYFIFTPKKN